MNDQFKPPSGAPTNTPNNESIHQEFAELASLIKEEYPDKPESQPGDNRLESELHADLILPPVPKKRRSCLGVILLLLLLLGGATVGGYLWLKSNLYTPVDHNSDDIITVKQGTSTQAIIAQLASIGIVKNPRVVSLYLRATGMSGQLRSGDYKFKSPISPIEALEKIQRGEVVFESV